MNLPSGYQKSACFFDGQASTVTTWLRSSDLSTMFTRHYTFGVPFILVFLQNSPNGKNLVPWKTVKDTWNSTLFKKIKKFWEDGIMKLPEKWKNVVKQNSEYVVQ